MAHKGVLRLIIRTHGKAAHSSEPWEGINAISKMGRIITALDGLAEEISRRKDPLLGPRSLDQAHKIDEFVSIDDYLNAVAIYRHLAESWFQRV